MNQDIRTRLFLLASFVAACCHEGGTEEDSRELAGAAGEGTTSSAGRSYESGSGGSPVIEHGGASGLLDQGGVLDHGGTGELGGLFEQGGACSITCLNREMTSTLVYCLGVCPDLEACAAPECDDLPAPTCNWDCVTCEQACRDEYSACSTACGVDGMAQTCRLQCDQRKEACLPDCRD